MGQISNILRRGAGRYFHWCPACECMHPLPDTWTFNGDVNRPTFSPSFRQTFHHPKRNAPGETSVCHYIITEGVIQFCSDSWHQRRDGIPMPAIPAGYRDDD